MKGVQIFTHSLRQVLGNLEGALRVSLVPYGIQIAASLLLIGKVESLATMQDTDPGTAVLSIFVLLISLFTSLWVAVAWHRYVLLNEHPKGLLPAVRLDRMGAYFLFSLGYGVMLALLALILSMVAGAVLAMLGFTDVQGRSSGIGGVIALALLLYLPLVVVAFRLSAALPGAALDTGRGFMAGWEATKGKTGDLIVLGVLAVGANVLLGFIGAKLFGALPILAFGWDAIVGWFVTMVGASILTTLYGHYVQGRPLNG